LRYHQFNVFAPFHNFKKRSEDVNYRKKKTDYERITSDFKATGDVNDVVVEKRVIGTVVHG
jgi:hypothetical protein